MQFSIGSTVGDYRIVDVIGSGGMGTVYKVQHVISDRIEAMKVILPGLIDSPELAERFMREIRLQARLSHPNITSLHNALRSGDNLLMVMEYVEGTTLHARLRQSRLQPVESIDIILKVLSALGYAHAQGVVHRDIKPGNIMLTRDGSVKLMDFGIARGNDHKDHLTRTGAAVGSLHYMSPEQVRGVSVDHRSDIYSLGITFYEMVTGQKPIAGDSSFTIMSGHITQMPAAPSAINPSVSPSLSLAILRAVEKRPEDRYQTADDFARILTLIRSESVQYANVGSIETLVTPSQLEPHVRGPAPSASTSRAPRSSSEQPQPGSRITPTPPSGSMGSASRFEPSDLERVKRELAVYVGPMAKILVDRAARKSQTLQQLYEKLSAEVPEGADRKKFLANRPR